MNKVTTNEVENQYWGINKTILGIDEAGRGPLAGPLVVAGVILPIGYKNELIYDSKGLSEKKREELFKIIIRDATDYKVKIIEPKQIDIENIYRATQNAMNAITDEMNADVTCTDAMPLPLQKGEVISLIKGDQKSISIAAASIIAKVIRDHIMLGYDLLYPEYGFKKHKGYPTKQHIDALEKYGYLKIHRQSYGPVQKSKQRQLSLF